MLARPQAWLEPPAPRHRCCDTPDDCALGGAQKKRKMQSVGKAERVPATSRNGSYHPKDTRRMLRALLTHALVPSLPQAAAAGSRCAGTLTAGIAPLGNFWPAGNICST